MTVLLSADAINARRLVVRDPLAPLARSLRDELTPLLDLGSPWIPLEKARLTKLGGRCPQHGALLEFDPWQPREHRCPVCGTVFRDDEHYRWWIMNYQLWLAERAVYAAALHVLTDDAACGTLAAEILRGYASRYASYPNRDNVLGPTRVFFSTYLESIWLLQLTVALDLLEAGAGTTALGEEVRERIVRPSAALIASYDEGLSNRQVYNNAALAAAGALLGDESMVVRALTGRSGLTTHFAHGLLADGTWYEGENYHLFAHRGLWYGVAVAEACGVALPADGLRRYRDAFATPFATALPDFTFPSRRDSQYKVSMRQWRMAESCELGLVRESDPRLVAALAELYLPVGEEGDSGRWRSTAEAERNVPPVRLSRASLGWKSLLFAAEQLPPLEGRLPTSVHLAGQGIAVMRRDRARTYVALDYGESGGGHGHPDRLNLWLVVGHARVLEDVGTGSYVDPSLHWYRSTLAHNAPLADGRSQWRSAGELTAYDERGGAGLVAARAVIAPGVVVERSVVVLSNYLVDEVRWHADRVITFDLPYHVDADLANGARWRPAVLAGGRGLEDGFDFISATEHLPGVPAREVALTARVDGTLVQCWGISDAPHEWWRCVAPGPPGEERRRFVLLRSRGRDGRIRSVWSWGDEVKACTFDEARMSVVLGERTRHEHSRVERGWRVALFADAAQSSIDLGGEGDTSVFPDREAPVAPVRTSPLRSSEADAGSDDSSNEGGPLPTGADTQVIGGAIALHSIASVPSEIGALLDAPVRFALGRAHYRRSESSWEETGRPSAVVSIAATPEIVAVEVQVPNPHPVFASRRDDNPLDNEHPDINSDGVQLYLGSSRGSGRYYSWILVPEGRSGRVRVTPRAAFGPPVAVAAEARLTPEGWVLRATVPRSAVTRADGKDFTLDVIINEITRDRERRRGQLVLSGAPDEWIYLRGDRQDSERALTFVLTDD